MIASHNQMMGSSRRNVSQAFRSNLSLLAIFLYFLLMTLALKTVFIVANWSYLRPEGLGSIARALLLGLRFDISILAYLFVPAILLYYTMVMKRWRLLKWIFEGYFIVLTFFIQVFWFADIQYFEEAGKHFTYEAFAYLGVSLLPILSGAFKLHPWLLTLSMFSSIGFSFITARVIWWCLKGFVPIGRISAPYFIFALIVLLMLEFIGMRGGMLYHPLKIGNSCISPSPYLNALCLNPIYSAFKTTPSASPKHFNFFNESFNIRNVRDLLGISKSPLISANYPLLRISPGSEKGNGKNIVIFILESWTGKDVGCLGSKTGSTPVFDDLSHHGMLFTNFFATGIRTAEGIFSILCSFPNQPLIPIMERSTIYQTRWRSISQILDDAGYYNIFIHGRDLDFDRMNHFFKYIHFHKIIDRHNFPPSISTISDSWPGYNDEEVMRRADEEFSKQNGHPFFGIVYTMNTHSPFVTPDSFPKKFPPTSVSNKFFNSLNYSDHALEIFLNLAKTKPYFKNTIFLFVADHTRTRDQFNFFDQHHIPMLIYSPGYIQPGVNPVVGSQLDILPTILGLLQLKTPHVSWGRNLLELPKDRGFAVSVVGNEVRWHDNHYLLNDNMTNGPLLMFDITRDPHCTTDIWRQNQQMGEILRKRIRSYISLSQTLLYQNRIYP